jgi:hypothetical protein
VSYMKSKVQIKPSVKSKWANMLTDEAKRRGQSYGVLVDEALERYFDPDSIKTRETILLKRMDQIDRKVSETSSNLAVFSEAFTVFVKTYLSRLVDIPKEDEAYVVARANKLFKEYLNQVGGSFAAGNSLFSNIPRDGAISNLKAEEIMKKFQEEEAREHS